MELSIGYILSQIFSIISYIILGITFYSKNRKTVLILGIFQSIFLSIGYLFLKQYQGMSMVIYSMIVNIVLFLDEKINGKSDKMYKKDIIILSCILIGVILISILTYTELLSLLSSLAIIVWIISVWVKQIKTYKLIMIIDTIVWFAFNVYAKSISGIIVEIILIITSIYGYILEIKKKEVA